MLKLNETHEWFLKNGYQPSWYNINQDGTVNSMETALWIKSTVPKIIRFNRVRALVLDNNSKISPEQYPKEVEDVFNVRYLRDSVHPTANIKCGSFHLTSVSKLVDVSQITIDTPKIVIYGCKNLQSVVSMNFVNQYPKIICDLDMFKKIYNIPYPIEFEYGLAPNNLLISSDEVLRLSREHKLKNIC
jgi:hypothetical protein